MAGSRSSRVEHFTCAPEAPPQGDQVALQIQIWTNRIPVGFQNSATETLWVVSGQADSILAMPGQSMRLKAGRQSVMAEWVVNSSTDDLWLDQLGNFSQHDRVGADDLYFHVIMPHTFKRGKALEATLGTYYIGARFRCCPTGESLAFAPPLDPFKERGTWSCVEPRAPFTSGDFWQPFLNFPNGMPVSADNNPNVTPGFNPGANGQSIVLKKAQAGTPIGGGPLDIRNP